MIKTEVQRLRELRRRRRRLLRRREHHIRQDARERVKKIDAKLHSIVSRGVEVHSSIVQQILYASLGGGRI